MKKKGFILTILILIFVFLLVACSQDGNIASNSSTIKNNENGLLSDNAISNPQNAAFRIEFVTNTRETIDPVEVSELTKDNAPIPSSVYKQGFRFEGWYINSSLTGDKVEFPYRPTDNVRFYAKWIENATIRISTPEDFNHMRNDLAGNYALANNINLEGYSNWEPIGNRIEPFLGTFDGNGYVVSNMTIKDLVADEEFNYLPYGLFGEVRGILKNVKLNNFNIKLNGDLSRFYIGGIAGHISGSGQLNHSEAHGIIDNPKFDYKAKFADSFVGSREKPTSQASFGILVGTLDGGVIGESKSSGTINSVSHAKEVYAGGIVGNVISGEVKSCHSSANVTAQYAGGLVGFNDGLVRFSYATGNLAASTSYPGVAGGLVAYNNPKGVITKNYATGNVVARNAGGLVGINIFDYAVATGGVIEDCYAAGNVFASEYAGGLAGRVMGKIPINGYDGYSPIVKKATTDENHDEILHRVIKRCLAYGSVKSIAERTVFLNKLGEEVTSEGVYFEVFAGGLIGDMQEVTIEGCMAFGNVEGLSRRALGDTEVYNQAFVNNVIGYSTKPIDSLKYRIYGAHNQVFKRNEQDYSSPQTARTLNTLNADFGASLRMELGLDASLWIVDDVNVSEGRYPRLHI